VIGIIFIGYRIIFGYNQKYDVIDNNDKVFFLKNSESKYALFNADGNQLTDFIYRYVDDFVNGVAHVDDGKNEGIINAKGKMTVPFGKYEAIILKGGLYTAIDSNNDECLIDANGKVLYKLDNINVTDYDNDGMILILEIKKENKYSVINYNGKELLSFSVVDDADKPKLSVNNEYMLISYNNKINVYNTKTKKELVSFNSEKKYYINSVSVDGNIILLQTVKDVLDFDDNNNYKVIKDKKKVYDITNECTNVQLENEFLLCYYGLNKYLVDSNFNVDFKRANAAYGDKNTFVINNYRKTIGNTNNSVDFYQNGNLIKSVSCKTLIEEGFIESDSYVLKSVYGRECENEVDKFYFYKTNGEKMFEKSFASANFFDSNGLAVVSDDKINYYLINKKGIKIGNTYSTIFLSKKHYIIENNKLEGLMNKDGKEIIKPIYSSVKIFAFEDRTLGILETTDKKYIIYDLDKNKEVFSVDSEPWFDNDSKYYIITKSNNKTQYYTIEGRLFYEK